MTDVDLQIVPGFGVPPLEFGMTKGDALTALAAWDTPIASSPDSSSLRVIDEHLTMDVFVAFDIPGRLAALEIWRPEAVEGARRVTVRLGDLPVFELHAEDVLFRLGSHGFSIDQSEIYHPLAVSDQLSLGFNREGGDYVDEEADDGLSRIFNSVLVAPAGYYDPPLK